MSNQVWILPISPAEVAGICRQHQIAWMAVFGSAVCGLGAAHDIELYVGRFDNGVAFSRSEEPKWAVLQRLTVIGEAAGQVSADRAGIWRRRNLASRRCGVGHRGIGIWADQRRFPRD